MATPEEEAYEKALEDAARAAAQAAAQAAATQPVTYRPAPSPAPVPPPAPAMVRCSDGTLVPAGTACPAPKRSWLPWVVGGAAVLAGVGVAYYVAKEKGMLRGGLLGEGSRENPTGLPRKYDYDMWRGRVVAIARDKHGVPTDYSFAVLDGRFGQLHTSRVRGQAWFTDGWSTQRAATRLAVIYKERG